MRIDVQVALGYVSAKVLAQVPAQQRFCHNSGERANN